MMRIISGKQSCFTWPSVNDPTVTTASYKSARQNVRCYINKVSHSVLSLYTHAHCLYYFQHMHQQSLYRFP